MNLIIDHVPQDELYTDIVAAFSNIPEVLGIVQRGSYASGSVDRASDLDVLIIVDDEHLEDFITSIQPRLEGVCHFLTTEGWIDTIVPDFGGIGLVFMVMRNDKLVQLDLYITAASAASKILQFPAKKILHQKSELDALKKGHESMSDVATTAVVRYMDSMSSGSQLLLETAIMYEIYAKHLYRRNPTLALKYRYGLIESVAKLIRYVFTPGKVDYAMYDWIGDFAAVNSPIVRMFERNIELIDVYSETQLKDLSRVIYALYFESALSVHYPEFLPVMKVVEEYVESLLRPDYTSEPTGSRLIEI